MDWNDACDYFDMLLFQMWTSVRNIHAGRYLYVLIQSEVTNVIARLVIEEHNVILVRNSNKAGAPNDGFLPNALKHYFRLSGVLLIIYK